MMRGRRGVHPWTAGRDDQGGAAAVELALLLPLLLVVLLGTMQVGTGFGQVMAIANGAREGARYGSQGSTCAEVVDRARDAMETSNIDPSTDATLNIVVRNTADDGDPTRKNLCPTLAAVPCEDPDATWVAVEVTITRALSIPFVRNDPDFTMSRDGVFACEAS